MRRDIATANGLLCKAAVIDLVYSIKDAIHRSSVALSWHNTVSALQSFRMQNGLILTAIERERVRERAREKAREGARERERERSDDR